MRVLFQSGTGVESLAAFGAGVRPRADVLRADVSLQRYGVREYSWTIFARITLVFAMNRLVLDKVRTPTK